MDSDHKNFNRQLLTRTHPIPTNFRRKTPLRRRKLPSVRLGGKRPRRGLLLVRLFRRARLRWWKLKYSCVLKKLKKYYSSVVKDLVEARATLESVQQGILIETSLAVPVLGLSFSSFPKAYGL